MTIGRRLCALIRLCSSFTYENKIFDNVTLSAMTVCDISMVEYGFPCRLAMAVLLLEAKASVGLGFIRFISLTANSIKSSSV